MQEQMFVNFPFTVESRLLDESVKDLFIFGDPRFCFQNAKNYILTVQMPKGFKPRQHPIIKTAAVNVQSYKIVSGENAMEEWMNDDLLNFFKAWIFRDSYSNLAWLCEIVPIFVAKDVECFCSKPSTSTRNSIK